MSWLARAYDAFRGIDPPERVIAALDGPLHPNTELDDAPVLLEEPGIATLCATPEGLFASAGHRLLKLVPEGEELKAEEIATLPAPITFLASDGAGALAIGQDGAGVVIRGGVHDSRTHASLRCPTAGLFLDPDTLIVANGSAEHTAGDWQHDLMRQGRSGSVWYIALSGDPVQLADGLKYPSGLALAGSGRVYVSEAWAHRVIALEASRPSTPEEVLGELPAYPGNILAAADGYWLALFAPRNPLIEFVIEERRYCERMIETVPPEYWIAPQLSSGESFLEPIQGGARKKLNTLKPWSPSWSYGLALHCDDRFRPQASVHSRADGQVHGVTSCAEQGGRILIAATGSGRIVALPRNADIGIGVAP